MHKLTVFLVAIALALMVTSTAVAAPDQSDAQVADVRFQTEPVEEDDGFDWGLLGLLGLAGLAGLLRRNDDRTRR